MTPASNLILVGPTGAGKSSLAPVLAARYALRLVDIDAEIERATGMAIPAIFEGRGEAGFRMLESATLADVLRGDGLLVATGAGIVLDAGNRRRLAERGFVVHLQATPAQQLARLAGDGTRPLLARDDRDAVLQAMATTREPLYAEVADLAFDTGCDGDFDAGEVAARLAARLDTHWHRNGTIA